MTQKNVNTELKKLGESVLSQIEKNENPNIDIPLRTLSNVIFDKKIGQLTLGDKSAKRYFFNVAHAKKFMQTLMVGSFCNSLLEEGIHTSIRDMYYNLKRTLPNSDENTFDEQSDSDPLIVDLEVALDVLREQLHLTTDRKGIVAGNVVIQDRGDNIDWSKLGSGGWSIPSTVDEIELKKVDAKFVLVVEKNAGFERLHEDKFWQKQKCILIGTGGQPSRGTRLLIQRLNSEHDLPVYVFTDADSFGFYIYSVIKSGSISLAHVSDRIATSEAKFIGLSISDIYNYNLKKAIIKAKEVDIKRAKELLEYEWFKKNPKWQKEINLMIEKGVKAEIEALSHL
ncbi:MAG: DNA topoisomerase IV subunit A, partial [Candidatus Aenigmarchaeota archaeon]|nr:DNA topoisomerase IV subunit A [Candidatus Aenigmarchaeota archaeon]MDI6722283.1 DNA topoisomerase IV subunit A [Candidatus Aenigmarchaeota archaeon]